MSKTITSEQYDRTSDICARRHLVFGWWSLLCFLTLGIVLESLHGFKIGWYLDHGNETRRLMWTLAHAHGVLLSLINVLFAVALRVFPEISERAKQYASPCLLVANIFLPGGFFLGGIKIYGGDPSVGVLLVPIGAAMLLIGVLVIAWTYTLSRKSASSEQHDGGGARKKRKN